MSLPRDEHRNWREVQRTRRAGALAAAIHREWWRPLKNRRRLRELRAIVAEDEQRAGKG